MIIMIMAHQWEIGKPLHSIYIYYYYYYTCIQYTIYGLQPCIIECFGRQKRLQATVKHNYITSHSMYCSVTLSDQSIILRMIISSHINLCKEKLHVQITHDPKSLNAPLKCITETQLGLYICPYISCNVYTHYSPSPNQPSPNP